MSVCPLQNSHSFESGEGAGHRAQWNTPPASAALGAPAPSPALAASVGVRGGVGTVFTQKETDGLPTALACMRRGREDP